PLPGTRRRRGGARAPRAASALHGCAGCGDSVTSEEPCPRTVPGRAPADGASHGDGDGRGGGRAGEGGADRERRRAVVEAARASRLLRSGRGERESRVLRPGRAVCASRVSRGRGVAWGVSPVLRDRGPALAEPRTLVGDVPRRVMCRSV